MSIASAGDRLGGSFSKQKYINLSRATALLYSPYWREGDLASTSLLTGGLVEGALDGVSLLNPKPQAQTLILNPQPLTLNPKLSSYSKLAIAQGPVLISQIRL